MLCRPATKICRAGAYDEPPAGRLAFLTRPWEAGSTAGRRLSCQLLYGAVRSSTVPGSEATRIETTLVDYSAPWWSLDQLYRTSPSRILAERFNISLDREPVLLIYFQSPPYPQQSDAHMRLIERATIILPCAGPASRFGAPYPKELHALTSGVTVIDRALEPVVYLAEHGLNVRCVVVFGPHKMETVKYLERYSSLLRLVFVYQDTSLGDNLAGAIRTALPLTEGPTALVLPDLFTSGPGAEGCLLEAIEGTCHSKWSVVAAPQADPDVLRTQGALLVEHRNGKPEVVAAAEKPIDPRSFNASWAMVAASELQIARLPDVVADDGAPSPLTGAHAVMVETLCNGNTIRSLK